MTTLTVDQVARIIHEANRAYCETQGDHSQVPYDQAPDWQKESLDKGILQAMQTTHLPIEEAAAFSHRSWMVLKEAEGWRYGEVKDPVAKTHPCFLPYEQLPVSQRRKDYIFVALVRVLTRSIP